MTEHIYAHEHPESDRVRGGGFTLWFTGLSGSGKSTIAHHVGPEMDRRGLVVEYLDGDTVRTHLSKGVNRIPLFGRRRGLICELDGPCVVPARGVAPVLLERRDLLGF